MLGTDIAIDLGSSSTRIFLPRKGIVLNQPSVVSVDLVTEKIFAIGDDAYPMLGKTCEEVAVTYPIKGGVIGDFDLTQKMISYFINQVSKNLIFMPRIVVCVPDQISEVEKRAVFDVIYQAGARKICLIKVPIAAALGANVDIFTPKGRLIVDIGSSCTDIAVLSLSDIHVSSSIKIGGNSFDSAVMDYVRDRYDLIIGKSTAEKTKIEIGTIDKHKNTTYYIKGKNLYTNLPDWATITSTELVDVLLHPAMEIANEIKNILEQTSPELIKDIQNEGIVLSGGASKLPGLQALISKTTKLPIRIAKNPENCVILGAGKSLEYIDSLMNIHEQKNLSTLNPLSNFIE